VPEVVMVGLERRGRREWAATERLPVLELRLPSR